MPHDYKLMVKSCFTKNGMAFGQTLREKRKLSGLSQLKLAERVTQSGVPVTDAYISMIEREYDKNKKGEATRVNRDLVVAIATALHWHVDEALVAANYAPSTQSGITLDLGQGIKVFLPQSMAPDAAKYEQAFKVAFQTVRQMALIDAGSDFLTSAIEPAEVRYVKPLGEMTDETKDRKRKSG